MARVPYANESAVDSAVAAAATAFESSQWQDISVSGRAALLKRLAGVVEANAQELADLEARDAGKAVSYTLANDLRVGIEALEFASHSFRALSGGHQQVLASDHIRHQLAQPVGVVVELLPWNGSIWTGLQRVASILAAGCTAVIKPSELASVTFGRISELFMEAGLPDGVINVVYGDGQTGAALVGHPRVDAVSLTGGTATGGRILETLARSIKPVTLELGGKNALIVLDDADVESAVQWAALGGFGNAGQVCVSSSRVIVSDRVHDEFVSRLAAAAQAVVVGDPSKRETQVGTLIGPAHANSVWAAIDGLSSDASVIAGGERYSDERSAGCFVPPTVVTDVPDGHPALTHEIFGPVITVERCSGPAEAVALANSSRYGLAAGVFTRDLDQAWAVSAALRAGEVYVNRWFSPGVIEVPVEGQRESGLGPSGIESYLRRTNVFFQRSSEKTMRPHSEREK